MDRPLQIRTRALQIQTRPSRIAQRYCAGVIFLSWLGIGLADLPWFVQVLSCAAIAVYGWCVIRSLQVMPIRMLECRDGNWFLRKDDCLFDAELGKKIFIGAGIVSLPFSLTNGERLQLVLWPDSSDADSLRRLRVALLAL